MGIKQLFNSLRASYIIGKAISLFSQARYSDAVILFDKANSLDKEIKNKENFHSYIGQCYLALGNNDYAIDHLSRAYELYSKNKAYLRTDNDYKEYINTLIAYRHILEKYGQITRAKEIGDEILEIRETKKGAEG